jgi:hypothetical protein
MTEYARMEAEVYWEGRLIGHLRDVETDQPHNRGVWASTGDSVYE